MPDHDLQTLMARQGDRVRAILNILVESPYFYASDDTRGDLFPFLLRYRREFASFIETYYGWTLVFDQLPRAKCARVFKDRWYNRKISEGKRNWFRFTKRDECLAFMILLEFFERQLEEQNITVEDSENLRFFFSDLLDYEQRRFAELFPETVDQYTHDAVRKILRSIMPELERYRMLEKLRADGAAQVKQDQTIYEALPALYHYNTERLGRPILDVAGEAEEENHGD